MKNVHVLPTDKPSRLLKSIEKGNLFLSNRITCGSKWINQNIYITSDEEIKEGDWFLTDDKRVEKCAPDWRAREWHKKIILTTDQDLIKDGVQSIDDEFLEWFVKNPSCEFVEVNINSFGECHMEGDDCSCYDTADQSLCKLYYPNYKIIIPKEEPKQHLIDMMKGDEELGLYDESREIKIEDIFNDEKREKVKRVIHQHKVLQGLSLVNPAHLQMTSNGHGEFPDSYKLTEKGIQYIIEQLNKE